MATAKRLIDANALAKAIDNHVNQRWFGRQVSESSVNWARYFINNAPTVDAVEVVRCKDCRHCEIWAKWNGGKYFACMRIPSEVHDVDPFHYCSYGERRCDNEAD